MKVKLNDKVLVISGKERGKNGKIIRILNKKEKVVVEKLNIRTKYIKKTAGKAGDKITFAAPMAVSNIMIVCPSCSKPTRIGHKELENGKRERVCKKCNVSLDQKSNEPSTKSKSRVKKVKV